MALKTRVKVGNITNLSDARYCAGMGVDMLGFKIDEVNGDGISSAKFGDISNWVSGPELVLELSDISADTVLDGFKINLIELPVTKISSLDSIKTTFTFIITLNLEDWIPYNPILKRHKKRIKYLLVTDLSGLDSSKVRGRIQQMSADFSLLLGCDLTPRLLEGYLHWPIAGFALNGSEETSPGSKDYEHLSSILEALEIE
jgi:phosphoribosylanthranilate isomerase